MKINVPLFARAHFWEAPPEDSMEFWAFRHKPRCQIGEELLFLFDGRPVAKAVVAGIEPPGISCCDGSRKFFSHWKVFWTPESFEALVAPEGPLFEGLSR